MSFRSGSFNVNKKILKWHVDIAKCNWEKKNHLRFHYASKNSFLLKLYPWHFITSKRFLSSRWKSIEWLIEIHQVLITKAIFPNIRILFHSILRIFRLFNFLLRKVFFYEEIFITRSAQAIEKLCEQRSKNILDE